MVKMKQAEFDELSDEELGRACVEPMLLSIRGKDNVTKTQMISSLNRSQQALCMFRIMYDHAKNSVGEYYAWIAYLLQAPGYWSGVMGGLRYFEDQKMMQLLEDTKLVIEERSRELNKPIESVSINDLDQDRELSEKVDRLYAKFKEIASSSMKLISTFIRSNPQNFVTIVG